MRRFAYVLLFAAVIAGTPAISAAAVIGKPANNLGLVGYWSLNEGVGTKAGDSSGNGNTGTFVGSPTWADGKLGKALHFGGSGNVDAGDINAMDGTAVLTMSAWMRRASPNAAVILEKSATGCAPFAMTGIDMWTDGLIYFMVRDGDYHGGAQTQNDTAWHHVVMVYDGNLSGQGLRLRGYIDGVLQPFDAGYVEPPATTASNSNHFNIGYSDCTGSSSDGDIDDVRVYNRALSEAQVTALYTASAARMGASSATLGTGTLANGLVGHWTFDGADVTDKVYDRSGYGNHGYWDVTFAPYGTSSAKTAGKLGQALRFSNLDTFVLVDTQASSLDLRGAMSMCAWFTSNSVDTSNEDFIIGKSTTDLNVQYGLYATASNGLGNQIGLSWQSNAGTTQDWWETPTSVFTTDGGWYHTCAVRESVSSVHIYINGVDQGVLNHVGSSASVTTANADVAIGRLGDFDADPLYWDGKLDDVRLYNRALTASEAKQLYNLGATKANASSQTLQSGSTLATSLVGHWTFDGADVTDKVYDRSTTAANGYFNGGATSSAKTIGKLGQAMRFDGTNDYVEVQSPSLPTGNFTYSVWVYPTNTSGFRAIATGHDAEFEWYMSDGLMQLIGLVGGNGAIPITENAWHHLALTRSGSVISMYVDGVLDDTGSDSSTLNFLSCTLLIGADSDAGACPGPADNGYFEGRMDDFRVYNRGFSATEVKQLYNLGR